MLTLLFVAMPGMVNILMLYMLIVTAFACLGMTLFGKVRHGEYSPSRMLQSAAAAIAKQLRPDVSLVAVSHFCHLRKHSSAPRGSAGEYINQDANFCTFPVAALTLFRCSTGEGWNGIMHDAMAVCSR